MDTKTAYGSMGSDFFLEDKSLSKHHDVLPPKVFTVKYDDLRGRYFLKLAEDFTTPAKLYGNITDHSERIITTFLDRSKATGVLLEGEKGSGKTMLSKLISIKLAERHNYPTIIVNEPYTGSEFFSFLQRIEQPAVVLFDEFEKTFRDREVQERLLTLFDGNYPSNKLYILTINDAWGVNENLKNRPGRLFYNIQFRGMESAAIKEYLEDVMVDKSRVGEAMELVPYFNEMNFDMVKALVEETNRFPTFPIRSHLNVLNVKPKFGEDYAIRCDVVVTNTTTKEVTKIDRQLTLRPFEKDDVAGSFAYNGNNVYLSAHDLIHSDVPNKVFTYKVKVNVYVRTTMDRPQAEQAQELIVVASKIPDRTSPFLFDF